jgi:excisionase family DNA binding protein
MTHTPKSDVKKSDVFLNPREAAELLGVHRYTINTWVRNGKIPYVRLGRNTVRIPKSDLLKLQRGPYFGPADHPGPVKARAVKLEAEARRKTEGESAPKT